MKSMKKYLQKHKIIIVCTVLISFAVCAVAPTTAMAGTYNLSGNQCYYGDGTCSIGEAMGKNAVDILVDVFWPDGIEWGMMGWEFSTGKTTPILKLLYDYYDTIGMIYKVFDDLEQVIRKDELKAILADGRDAAARLAVIEEDAVKYGKYLQSNQKEPDYGPFYNRTLAVRNTAQQIRCDSVKFSGNSRKALLDAAEDLDAAALACYDNVKVIVEEMRMRSTPQQTTEVKKTGDDIVAGKSYTVVAYDGRVMNIFSDNEANKVKNSTAVGLYRPTGHSTQKVVAEQEDGAYYLHFGSKDNKKVLDTRNSSEKIATGNNQMQVYDKNGAKHDQLFILKQLGNGKHVIALKANPKLVVTCEGNKLVLKTYVAGNKKQEFLFKAV